MALDASVTINEIARYAERLHARYKSPRLYNLRNPLSELIFIVLSAQTPESKYLRAYRELRRSFPTWRKVAEADDADLERILRPAGLASVKTAQIKAILRKVRADQGAYDLKSLREMDDRTAEFYLTSLPGVGIKTARCVLMFSLGRNVLPVDIHVFRVMGRVGFHEFKDLNLVSAQRIQEMVPENLRYSVHVNTVAHGRALCRKHRPLCDICPINNICSYAKQRRVLDGGSLAEG